MIDTVLMVDGDEVFRGLTIKALESEGVNAIACATADDAWQIIGAGEKVDLVVTSIEVCGELDGIALAKLICERRPGLRIVLTAEHMELTPVFLPRQIRLMTKPWPTEDIYNNFIKLFKFSC